MGVVTAISIGLGVASAGASYEGSQRQETAIRRMDRHRAAIALVHQADILQQGKDIAEQIRIQARQIRGDQKAQMAANGIVIGEGTSQTMLDTVDALAEADALIVMQEADEQAAQVAQGAEYDSMAAVSQQAALRMQGYSQLFSAASGITNSYQKSKLYNKR